MGTERQAIQLIRNQQVTGSNPVVGSSSTRTYASSPEAKIITVRFLSGFSTSDSDSGVNGGALAYRTQNGVFPSELVFQLVAN